MYVILIMRVVFFALMIIGILILLRHTRWVSRFLEENSDRDERDYGGIRRLPETFGAESSGQASQEPTRSKSLLSAKLGAGVFVFGLLGFLIWLSAVYVSPTQAGVLENQTNGSLTLLDKGLHVWPLDFRVIPIITRVSKYSYSSKADGDNSLILGEKDDIGKRIASSSSSPGRPSVYFWVKVVAVPNRDQLLLLHRRYGAGYLDGYVRNNFESAVKTVQGQKTFDYLSENRASFEEEVRKELERRMGLETDGVPLLSVTFVNVLDYDYDQQVNDQLNNIVSAENDAKAAEARVKSAIQDAEAVRETANGARDAEIEKAEGARQASNKKADADLYAKQQEAIGISVVQAALASSPTYIELQQAQRWDGKLPQFMGGSSPVPFLNLSPAPAP